MTMGDASVVHDGQMAQVLLEVGKLSTQIAVVQNSQDNIRAQITDLGKAQSRAQDDHENRLRALELAKPKTAWPQIVGYIGVVLPTWALVIDLITRHG